jgi:hypothetical protein
MRYKIKHKMQNAIGEGFSPADEELPRRLNATPTAQQTPRPHQHLPYHARQA